jgi:nucleotide-binding universal stress UspA family protein
MIVEIAEEKAADIVFMGSYGRTGLKKLLMGSVTEKVIGNTSCPVMVVKPQD